MKQTSATKTRRTPLQPTPLQRPASLTERDIHILQALHSYGVLTTLQMAMLFFPPDLDRRLAWWGFDPEQINRLREQYSAHRLNERMELGKWLLAMQRQFPEQLQELDSVWQKISSTVPELWLLEALVSEVLLPEKFVERQRLPSDFINAACKHRLRYLLDVGYLEAQEQPTRLSEGRKPTLWGLSKQGAQYIAQQSGVTLSELSWKPLRSHSPALLPHRLDNNDIRICFELAAQRHGWTIRRSLGEDELRRLHSQPSERVNWSRPRHFTHPEGEWVDEEGSVVADQYLWLDTGKNWHNFIECDRGTQTGHYVETDRNDFARKIRAFSSYYRSGRFAVTYPEAGKSMRVLIITTSEARLQNLKSITENVVAQISQNEREIESGLIRYWLTTFEHLRPTWYDWFSEATILDAPVWLRAGQSHLRPVIW